MKKDIKKHSEEYSSGNLMLEYYELIRRIAIRMHKNNPDAGLSVDDLIHAGLCCLKGVKDRYDPNRGTSFETFAGIRIKGSMQDEFRSIRFGVKSVYKKHKDLIVARKEVENITKREAKGRDVAEKTGITLDEYYKREYRNHIAKMEEYDDVSIVENFRLSNSKEGVLDSVIAESDKEDLLKAVKILPKRERLLILLYYYHDMSLKDSGLVLGISESRACQIHKRALRRLKKYFEICV